MANTNGGTIYIGVSANPKEKPEGIHNPKQAIERLQNALSRRFSPEPDVDVDHLGSQGMNVVRVTVQPGTDLPYALDDNRFYVRDETETNMAVRDEIVRLVERKLSRSGGNGTRFTPPSPPAVQPQRQPSETPATKAKEGKAEEPVTTTPPSTGVEIVESRERDGTIYHTVHDLRNGNRIKNVTRSSARKLWHYAITQIEDNPPRENKIDWHGNVALLDVRSRDKHVWYDLALRTDDGIRVFYGVTDSGLNEEWMELIEATNNGSK
jgi:hypothetical protein